MASFEVLFADGVTGVVLQSPEGGRIVIAHHTEEGWEAPAFVRAWGRTGDTFVGCHPAYGSGSFRPVGDWEGTTHVRTTCGRNVMSTRKGETIEGIEVYSRSANGELVLEFTT